MNSCLGIFIQPHIIKYAKILKDRDTLTVESFGVKFYDKLGETLNQIISDTYSFKSQISINLSEESYQYFYMFTLLNKADLRKAIKTEFEVYCSENGINKNAIEARYILVNSKEDKEKIKVIHMTANKTSIVSQEQHFAEYKLSTISPISTSISNIVSLKDKENILVVNMEDETTVTTIVDKKIYQINKIEEGAQKVLDAIAEKENSYSRAYEICKNSTIYTIEGQELQEEANEHLEYIMPTLYSIANKVKQILNESMIKITKIYLTGTLSVVNNIDLYFQEVLETEKCEILKPFFIKDTNKINIKDYIEVNSAIALALQGLEYGIKDTNFKQQTTKESLDNFLSKFKFETKDPTGKSRINLNLNMKIDLKQKLDATEKWLLRGLTSIILLITIYSGLAIFINKSIDDKKSELADVNAHTQVQIKNVEDDIVSIQNKTSEYERLAENLKNISNQISEDNKNRNNIPNLLHKIMYAIPNGVQITSIENTNSKHIIIQAQSEKYEQLGYFKAILKTNGILSPDTVVSSVGEKTGNLVKVVIEGDLP